VFDLRVADQHLRDVERVFSSGADGGRQASFDALNRLEARASSKFSAMRT